MTELQEVKKGSMVFSANNILSEEECERIIAFYDKNEVEHSVPSNTQRGPVESLIKSRSMSVHGCAEKEVPEAAEIDNLIFNAAGKLIQSIHTSPATKDLEIEVPDDSGYMISKYEEGGYYNWHCDAGAGVDEDFMRILTCVFYLNNVEDGGGTGFKFQDLVVEAERGKVAVFSPSFTHRHRGEVVKKGVKYTVVTWMGIRTK